MQSLERSQDRFQARIARGLRALELNRFSDALDLFREAQGLDPLRPESWYWMGRTYEDLEDAQGAGYCYQLARELGHNFRAATQGLRRLGYLGIQDRLP